MSAQEMLRPLIQEAKDRKMWLHTYYQDIWFSPDELEAMNKEGRFLWGPVNWELRNPKERVEILKRGIHNAKKELDSFEKRLT